MAARQTFGYSPNKCEWLQDCIYVPSIPSMLQVENHARKKEKPQAGNQQEGDGGRQGSERGVSGLSYCSYALNLTVK